MDGRDYLIYICCGIGKWLNPAIEKCRLLRCINWYVRQRCRRIPQMKPLALSPGEHVSVSGLCQSEP